MHTRLFGNGPHHLSGTQAVYPDQRVDLRLDARQPERLVGAVATDADRCDPIGEAHRLQFGMGMQCMNALTEARTERMAVDQTDER